MAYFKGVTVYLFVVNCGSKYHIKNLIESLVGVAVSFYPLEKLMNLYDGYQRAFVVEGKPLLLIQDEGRCYLILNQCPHQSMPLTHGTVQQGHLRCPVHGMSFSLKTGISTDGCPAGLQFIPLAYEGNQLGVFL